jgi:beta-lactamase regulating signal transducer with metallopeptidase domain
MILSWMVYAGLVALLLALAAHAADVTLRAGRHPARWIWAAAVLASVLIPVLAYFTPPDTHVESTPTEVTPVETYAGFPPVVVESSSRRWADGISPLPSVPPSPRLDAELTALWLAGSSAILLFLTASYGGLQRRRRRWKRVTLSNRGVWVSRDTGPAVIGFFPGEVVIPEWVVESGSPERELVLSHEFEHVRALDPALLLMGLVACAALPWNLALWWAGWRLRRAVEVDCDLRVLAGGADPRAYSRLLLDVTEKGWGYRFALCGLRAPTSFLERRIRLMLSSRLRWSRTRTAAALVVVVGLSLSAFRLEKPPRPGGVLAELEAILAPVPRPSVPVATASTDLPVSSPQVPADTLPLGQQLEEMARQLAATAAEVEALQPDAVSRQLEEMARQLAAASAEIESLQPDTLPVPRQIEEAMAALRAAAEQRSGPARLEASRTLEAARAELEALRADTSLARLRMSEAVTALRAASEERGEQLREQAARSLEAVRAQLEASRADTASQRRLLSEIQATRTAAASEVERQRATLERLLESRQRQDLADARRQADSVAQLRAALEAVRGSAANAAIEIRICVVPDGQLRTVTGTIDPLSRDTLIGGAPIGQVAPPGPPNYAEGAAWFGADVLSFDGRVFARDGAGTRLVESELLQRIGEVQGTPIFAETGNVAPHSVIFVPVREGCEFQVYRDVNARR